MRSRDPILKILDILRSKQNERITLDALLEPKYQGHIPTHTGGGIFGDAIAKLLDLNFIKLFDENDRDITFEIISIGEQGDKTLMRGYEIAQALAGREREVSASLTKRLFEIQSLLGFSVTQLLEDANPEWMRVRPLYGKPSQFLREDVFVLMPFRQDLHPVYTDHIQKVCGTLKLECKRADDMFSSTSIINDVWQLIANSKIIIADCTGRNPNVFYELGIAHTIGKKVIIVTQSEDDIPFDIKHIRYIKYHYTPRGMKEFEKTLKLFLSEEVKEGN